jgi:hypothetical protein
VLGAAEHIGVVLGSEGTGLRQQTEAACDWLASIPMRGRVPCLNVRYATHSSPARRLLCIPHIIIIIIMIIIIIIPRAPTSVHRQ